MTDPLPRPFLPADAAAVADLILPIQRQEFGLPVTLADQPDLEAIPAFYQVGRGGFWVVEQAGRIVGTIGLRDFGGRRAALRKMFVAAPWRGRQRGVAQVLLECALAHALQAGVRALWLGTTGQFLAAHRFYERNGFERVERGELPPDFPVMAVDSRFYRREVVPDGRLETGTR